MKSQFFNKICIYFISIVCIYALSLFINVSTTFAWATGRGCIYYNGQPLNTVNVKELTKGEIRTSGSDGDGCYSFDQLDCNTSPESKVIQILGWGSGSPPHGIPAGGTFNPSSFTMGEFGNGQVISLYSVNYVAPPPPPPPATAIPIPTPTLSPCGGPCTANSQCGLACPICANGTCAVPTPTPTLTPTPTPAACGGPCTVNNQCGLACPICANGICAAPTPTPVPCGGPCTSSNQCAIACPICANGLCAAPSPTPTPTPSCNCDGLNVQGIFYTGTNVDVTGYAKVMDPDNNPAEVLSMVYTLYKDNEELTNSGEMKVAPNPERTTDSSGITIDRYNSNWNFTISSPGSYKILEKINCGWKANRALGTQTNNILGSDTSPATANNSNKNLFSIFFSWINGLINQNGDNSSPLVVEPTSTPTPTPFNPLEAKSLKLKIVSSNLTVKCTEATFDVAL